MSAPPPGGSPRPQSPPPYPQYSQQPPQGYPPQYPPPQPYYATPAPPPKESNTALIVVLVVVVVVVVLAALAWYVVTAIVTPAQNLTRVTITAATWTVSGDMTDFASSDLVCDGQCPMTVFVGSPFSYSLTLRNTDPLSAHNVTSISVGSPFTLVSSTPVLPATIPASSSTTFLLSIDASAIGGSYSLSGVIYTS